MNKGKGDMVLPAADLMFATASGDIAKLAARIDRYQAIVAGAPMTADEQFVFDALGDDDPCAP